MKSNLRVVRVSLKEIAFNDFFKNISSKPYQISKKDYFQNGKYPIIDQGQKFVVAYTDKEEKLYKDTPIIIFGDHTRILKYIDFDFVIGADGTKILLPIDDSIDTKYAYYQLLHTKIESLGYSRHYKLLKEKTFIKPPLTQQKTIAQTLDKAKELIELRKETIKKLDELAKSVFIDMFGDPVENPMGWEDSTLGNLIHSAKDGPHESPKYSDEGVPFLSARHVRPNEIIWNDLKYIDIDTANRYWKKCKPEIGDILYSKGGTTGFAASVKTDKNFAIWVHLALLKPIHEIVNYIWLESMLNTGYCYAQSQHLTKGIANKDLGLKRMVNIKLYLPSLTLQTKFANIIQKIETQKALYEKELDKLEENFEALLAKSFG